MQNMPIAIFRGDDTDALGYQTIVGTIRTDLDLTGCKAVFKYLSFSVEFNPIPADKKLTVIIPASETKKFPPGLGYASLRVYDAEGKLCTFSNRIMVFVATKTPMFGNEEFEVDFNVRPELEPLKIFVGPNPDDFDEYRGFLEKVIDRASAAKYGLAILLDAIDSDLGAEDGVAATPAAVKAAYAAVIGKLTDEYYTKGETDEAIDRVAAYYITYDAVGHAFPTRADLVDAQTYYSGGNARTPTRNDYAIVLADESHDGAEWRYIYAVPDGQTAGQWEPQYPVEGVMTVDQTVTKNSQNPVASSGIWSMIWGALTAVPTGFSSLYDWAVDKLSGKLDKSNGVASGLVILGGEYSGYQYAIRLSMVAGLDIMRIEIIRKLPSATTWSTVGTQMFQNATGTLALRGDIPIQGITVNGTLQPPTNKVVNIPVPVASTSTPLMDGTGSAGSSTAFARGDHRHPSDTGKINVSGGLANQLRLLIAATNGSSAGVYSLRVRYEEATFHNRARLEIVKQPAGGSGGSSEVIVATIDLPASDGTLALTSQVDAKLDASSASAPFSSDPSVSYPVGSHCTYQGKLYKCTTATTGGTWVAASWEADTMTDPDAVLDITSQNQLRVVAKNGTLLWAQGYDLASTSSATLACDACNNFTFANGATSQAFALPTAPTGKVGDFGLDIDNSANTSAVTMTLTGLDTTFSVVVPKGDSLNDMLSIAAGELARFYISLSTFRINNLPTWHIMKQAVENGGATV